MASSSPWLVLMLMSAAMCVVGGPAGTNNNENEALALLKEYDTAVQVKRSLLIEATWGFFSNLSKVNQIKLSESDLKFTSWQKRMSNKASKFNTAGFSPDVQRQLYKIKDIGTSALSNVKMQKKLTSLTLGFQSLISTATVCLDGDVCLPFEPNITEVFKKSRDEEMLRRLWVGWRDATGKKMRTDFSKVVAISNKAIRSLGFNDTGEYWRSTYESPTFEKDMAKIYSKLKTFYTHLHAYVRRRLKAQYGSKIFPSTGHIPAHLMGDIFGQSFNGVEDLLMPFPNKSKLGVTEEMVKQGYTAERIFRTADSFYTSLGMIPMPQEFWNNSLLEKPNDGRNVVCHPSAWDFYNGVDFRVMQCTEVTMQHFSTAHHEMGHIEYFLQYKHLPVIYRDGANPGFHEAIGDTISMSVETPQHLHKLGLLPTLEKDPEVDINFLMSMALRKIGFLPYGYLIDKWRWNVFRKKTSKKRYNKVWWKLRCKLQGVSPPVKRSEKDFDPAAKFHVAIFVPYMRYFVSTILQFQFHKSLCQAAGHKGPLHTCDISNSLAAGQKLSDLLRVGSSKVWTVPFKALTGETQMSVKPLMEYFRPLILFLRKENKGQKKGWKGKCPKIK